MNNLSEYRRDLDALHFTPDQIDAIARRAAEGAARAKNCLLYTSDAADE